MSDLKTKKPDRYRQGFLIKTLQQFYAGITLTTLRLSAPLIPKLTFPVTLANNV
jgi:hypothetical protein